MNLKFLVWSGTHKAWWRPEGNGYTKKRAEAGRYGVSEIADLRLDGASDDTICGADVLVLDEE